MRYLVLAVSIALVLEGCTPVHIQNKVCIAKFLNTTKEPITVVLEDGSSVKVPAGQSFECGK